MVDALAVVAFTELFADEPSHHNLHPLLADDSILRLLQPLVVVEIDTFESGRDGRLLSQEGCGFGGRHGETEAPISFEVY